MDSGTSRFFANETCEYYPCHPGGQGGEFNCLFCYCPLYHLGEACGGQFGHTPAGVKDCTPCLLPHRREGYDVIVGRLTQIQREEENR